MRMVSATTSLCPTGAGSWSGVHRWRWLSRICCASLSDITGRERTSMQYCTQHDRLYVPPLGQWVPLPHGQLSGPCREVPITEACCDRCVALATTSMAQQFPHLYTASAAWSRYRKNGTSVQ
jgi:hypothetical protein